MRWLLLLLLLLPGFVLAEEETPAPAEEETPAPAEEETPAEAEEETPAPAEEETAPAKAEEETAPAEAEEETAPAEAEEETAPAKAEEETAPEVPAPGMGRLTVLRDRTGGVLNLVRKRSRESEIVRAGNEFSATPGFTLGAGDAIRTRQGVVAIEVDGGLRIEIGERSQIRFDPGLALVRLGELIIESPVPYIVQVGGASVTLDAGLMRVRGDLEGRGVVQVFSGSAKVTDGAGTRNLSPMQTTELSGDAGIRDVPPTEQDALVARRAKDFVAPPPSKAPVTSTDRAHIIIGGGLVRVDRAEFGAVDLSGRIRIAGPAWVHMGASLVVRPADELDGYDAVLALPARFGVRFLAELPRAVFILGGADFSLLFGERCTSLEGCPRVFSVEPGGWLDLGMGIYIHKRVGLQFELAGGLHRRRLPPPSTTADEIIFPELQAQGLVSIFVRL